MTIPRCCALVAVFWIFDPPGAAAQCAYTVSPTSFTAPSTSGTRTISVVTGTQCSWTATSAVSWITITSGAGATGFGSTTFVIEPNPAPGTRTGILTVAGQTVSVTQQADSCSYSVSPPSLSLGSPGTSRTLSVIAGTLCSWTATSRASWITITNPGTGSGASAVTFSVTENTAPYSRTGFVAVAGQEVTVTQSGTIPGSPPPPPAALRIVY